MRLGEALGIFLDPKTKFRVIGERVEIRLQRWVDLKKSLIMKIQSADVVILKLSSE